MMYRIWAPALLILICAPLASAAGDDSPINLRKTVIVQVVAQTKSAVVNISTTKLVNRRVNPFGNDPFWQQFDVGQMVQVPANSLGSGFIIHSEGYVVTNNHVIDRARQITVELADGRKLPAELLSADADADLALLKISDPKPFPTIELGANDDLMIGEPAIAIGNPMGFSHSVSTGIISALHRDLKDNDGNLTMADLIQTDAAINPGNSGGPLLNAYGQVIGINTAIRSDAQNIGFAIPIDRLRDLIPELMNPSAVKHLNVPLKLAERRELSPPDHITCKIVTADNPAQFVRAINGKEPLNIVDAYDLLLGASAQQTINVEFADGSTRKIVPQSAPTPDAIVQAKNKLGMTVEALTPMLAEKLHLSEEDGLLVDAVTSDSPAGRAGLRQGDIVVALGRFPVSTLDQLAGLMNHMPDSGRIRIGVIRDNELQFGTLDLGESKI